MQNAECRLRSGRFAARIQVSRPSKITSLYNCWHCNMTLLSFYTVNVLSGGETQTRMARRLTHATHGSYASKRHEQSLLHRPF